MGSPHPCWLHTRTLACTHAHAHTAADWRQRPGDGSPELRHSPCVHTHAHVHMCMSTQSRTHVWQVRSASTKQQSLEMQLAYETRNASRAEENAQACNMATARAVSPPAQYGHGHEMRNSSRAEEKYSGVVRGRVAGHVRARAPSAVQRSAHKRMFALRCVAQRRTHTHTRMHTHARAHAHMHTHAHIMCRRCQSAHACARAFARTHERMNERTNARTRVRTTACG